MATIDRVHSAAAEPASREGQVLRFTLAERLAHWNHAVTFIVLFVTGAALVFRGVSGMANRETLMLFSQIHRFTAVLFTVVTIPLLFFGARKYAGEWVRSSFQFDKDDRTFLARFAKEFFGMKVELPHQGKFNAGEKINSILQILGWPLMVISGWMLVYKESLPQAVAQWTLPLHSFMAFALGAAVIGHIYLATFHPASRPGLSGMTTGWVPRWWAKSHYRKWYDAVSKEK